MSIKQSDFNFNQINDALAQLNALPDAAETHGLMCAYICHGNEMHVKDWTTSLFATPLSDDCLNSANGQLLIKLYQFSLDQLQSFDFDFYLLLPDDDTTLSVRSEAIGAWCQGLLTGLTLANPSWHKHPPAELQDTLEDLAKIAMIDYQDADNTEENETAYAEVVEFVRMATLLIHSICNAPVRHSSHNAETTSDRIH